MQSVGTTVLLVTSNKSILAILKQILLPPIFALTVTNDVSRAKHLINEKHFALIMIDLLDSDDLSDTLDISDELSIVILMVEPQKLDHISYRVSGNGVIAISKTTDIYGFYNVIRITTALIAKVEGIALKQVKLKEKMNEIQLVSRAKLLLMEKKKMSEEDAHRYIEKYAMDERKKRAVVAREILESI